MNKEIKVVDEVNGIVRVTTLDERWYAKSGSDPITGLPIYAFFPSSTWISGHYPKGIGFYKWLADRGWDEAEALKVSAGDRGSKVHEATEILERDGFLSIDTPFINKRTDFAETLTFDEIDCVLSFARWFNEVNPVLLASEMTVFGDGYAGTLDRIYRINGQIYIVDLKTSKQIWEEMKLQISSYNNAKIDYKSLGIAEEEWKNRKMAILQLGYPLNKAGFKFTEIEDKYELFKMAKAIWANENSNAKPKQKDYPLTLILKKGNQDDTRTNESMGKEKQQILQAG